jgi:hypothetical protein
VVDANGRPLAGVQVEFRFTTPTSLSFVTCSGCAGTPVSGVGTNTVVVSTDASGLAEALPKLSSTANVRHVFAARVPSNTAIPSVQFVAYSR